jgi:hypothetical protein
VFLAGGICMAVTVQVLYLRDTNMSISQYILNLRPGILQVFDIGEQILQVCLARHTIDVIQQYAVLFGCMSFGPSI